MTPMRRVCAVLPAAGLASRMGGARPKILLEIDRHRTIWDVLWERLHRHVAHIHVVLPPGTEELLRERAARCHEGPQVTTSVQSEPTGMGDAIFGAAPHWRDFDDLLVVWGDQVSLSEATVERTLRAHASGRGRRVTLPLVAVDNPYVQYVVDAGTQRIVEVRERREGRSCEPGGLADVGVFCLSVDGLEQAWVVYRRSAHPGERTGEVAFLPFLPYLNSCAGWSTSRVGVGDPAETRGVNTLDDLEFFRGQLVSRSR